MADIQRIRAVMATMGHRSHASIYNAIKVGLFTKPVRLGARSVGWPSEEVQTILAARIAGKEEAEIRVLVHTLHFRRQSSPMLIQSP